MTNFISRLQSHTRNLFQSMINIVGKYYLSIDIILRISSILFYPWPIITFLTVIKPALLIPICIFCVLSCFFDIFRQINEIIFEAVEELYRIVANNIMLPAVNDRSKIEIFFHTGIRLIFAFFCYWVARQTPFISFSDIVRGTFRLEKGKILSHNNRLIIAKVLQTGEFRVVIIRFFILSYSNMMKLLISPSIFRSVLRIHCFRILVMNREWFRAALNTFYLEKYTQSHIIAPLKYPSKIQEIRNYCDSLNLERGIKKKCQEISSQWDEHVINHANIKLKNHVHSRPNTFIRGREFSLCAINLCLPNTGYSKVKQADGNYIHKAVDFVSLQTYVSQSTNVKDPTGSGEIIRYEEIEPDTDANNFINDVMNDDNTLNNFLSTDNHNNEINEILRSDDQEVTRSMPLKAVGIFKSTCGYALSATSFLITA